MLVSIIIPVYNVENYLRECLDSVLSQTYRELEIILVDDGSKDNCGIICDEYAEKYDNFTVIHKENAGLGMARNTGMEYMHGDYVCFLDSDDYIEPTLVECLLTNLLEKHVDMCKGGFQRITDNKKTLSTVKYKNEVFQGEQARLSMLPRMVGSRPDKKDSIEMCVWGAIYNTSHIKENKLRFPSERELISEDLVFNIDYMQHANGACTIENVGYNYRMNMNSLSKRYRPDRFEASRYFYLSMKDKLTEFQYDELTMLRLKRIFFIYVKMALAQEVKQISGHSFKECIERIKYICSDRVVVDSVEDYPVERLGIPQKIFLSLVKKKSALILYLYFNFRNIATRG